MAGKKATKVRETVVERNMKRYLKYSVLFLALVLLSCAKTDAQEVQHLTTRQVHDLMTKDTNLFLIDVRSEEEYTSETGHLHGAHLIPVDELESRIAEVPPSKKVIAYCHSGRRSAQAAEILSKQGIRASTMDGGIVQWQNEGFEVERSPK
jgi:rhodanese-related sulfurtransferase